MDPLEEMGGGWYVCGSSFIRPGPQIVGLWVGTSPEVRVRAVCQVASVVMSNSV